jgi:hypothetical protein
MEWFRRSPTHLVLKMPLKSDPKALRKPKV